MAAAAETKSADGKKLPPNAATKIYKEDTKIKIKKLDGQLEVFMVDLNQTISQVKVKLSEKAGIDQNQIRLIYRGAPLVDTQTLHEANIKANDMLHMIMQMRGGYFYEYR